MGCREWQVRRAVVPVVHDAAGVQQVGGDGTVLIGAAEVGVEPIGEPVFGVVGQQPAGHLPEHVAPVAPEEREEFTIPVPAALVHRAVSVMIGVPVLVNE